MWCVWTDKWFVVNKENKKMLKWAQIKKMIETDGTIANFVIKSILGFISGIMLTMTMFVFLLLQLNYSYTQATVICSFVGSVLPLALAFSPFCRSICMMVLPQLFSEKGRHVLIMYAFMLTFSGPSKTTLQNTEVLSESFTCLQEEIESCIRKIVEIIKKPLLAVRTSVTRIRAELATIVKKMKEAMSAVKNTVTALVRTIKSAYEWLYSVMNICNKKVGTPYQRCTKMFEDALDECKVSVPSIFDWMCSISYVISHVCYAVKFLDSICEFFDFINESIFGAIRGSLKNYVRQMKNMFYVSVEMKHSFSFESTPSRLSSDIIRGIITEIKYKIDDFVLFFDWAGLIFSFFFLYVFVRVLQYRQKYLTIDSFDNKYLTQELYDLDDRKQILDRPTIFPLSRVEKNKFIERTSVRLLPKEKRALFRSLAIMVLATFKIVIQMAVDYSLYWILITVRKYGRLSSQLDPPKTVDVNVDGDGLLADLYRTIIHTFTPVADDMNMDTMSCLPNPLLPDYDCYRRIIVVLILTWIMAIVQPYGLRFRSYTMGYYHPDVARTRAVWLHDRIIRRRINFVTFAQRFLRRKFGMGGGGDSATDPSCLDFIYSKYPFLDRVWSRRKQMVCLLCGYKAKGTDLKSGDIVLCVNENCKGVYCSTCFADIDNKCTLCSNPLDYGDITDVSEEKDSSDERQKNFEILHAKRGNPSRKTLKQRSARAKNRSSSSYYKVSPGEEADDESSSGGDDDSDDTRSTVSNSYENDPDYVNAPLNYAPLIVESQHGIRRGAARTSNGGLRVVRTDELRDKVDVWTEH